MLGAACVVTSAAQSEANLVVWHKDGSRVLFSLSEEPRISYAGDMVTIQAGTTIEYPFQSIRKMTFEGEEAEGISQAETTPARPFASDGATVSFQPSDRDLRVRLVAASGTVVREFTVRRGEPSQLSLSAFPAGVYLMIVNGVTYKIMTR